MMTAQPVSTISILQNIPGANVFSFRLVLAPVCRDVRLDGLSVSFVSVQAEAVKITELI